MVIDDESTGLAKNLKSIRSNKNFRYIEGSVADEAKLLPLLHEADEVYHLAAAVGVKLIAESPIDSIERNIAPVQFILKALAKRHQEGRAVKLYIASSSEVYGKNPTGPWCEDADLVFGPTTRARWSYGAAKALDEFLALAYWRQIALPVVVGRFFNVVGPRQRGTYGMVLPRFVEAALAGKSPIVHDDGKQIRCFAHVMDVCKMMLGVMASPAAVGQVINIGSDEPTSIQSLAEQVLAAVDPSLTIQFQSYNDAYSKDFEDVRVRVPNLDKLHSLIDYRAEYNLQGIIEEVIAWKRG